MIINQDTYRLADFWKKFKIILKNIVKKCLIWYDKCVLVKIFIRRCINYGKFKF